MPWIASDASEKTHKADTPKLKKLWATVANSELESTGDDARAVKAANSVVAKQHKGSFVYHAKPRPKKGFVRGGMSD